MISMSSQCVTNIFTQWQLILLCKKKVSGQEQWQLWMVLRNGILLENHQNNDKWGVSAFTIANHIIYQNTGFYISSWCHCSLLISWLLSKGMEAMCFTSHRLVATKQFATHAFSHTSVSTHIYTYAHASTHTHIHKHTYVCRWCLPPFKRHHFKSEYNFL